MQQRWTSVFLSHGGGPLPLLGDPGHDEMVACLQTMAERIPRPSAILVISAHWEATTASITSTEHPALLYDYHGFPEEAYRIAYPCPGEPALAGRVRDVLTGAGIEARLDAERGLDHGVFVPLQLMYPGADIPCVQLSLVRGLDPADHIAIGRALREIAREDLLVIGSGFSFHNMQAFFSPVTPDSRARNEAFEGWLRETCADPGLGEQEREARLLRWEQAPAARFCHPREEHLLPLHVCCGLAGGPCSERFELEIMNRMSSMYLWRPGRGGKHDDAT